MSSSRSLPLVSVLTPVYNGADHLAECIESVLGQTYSHWDYTIVDNCSTDESLDIAHTYAAKDSRIRVVSTDRFLSILENHNFTARQISPDSKYCKFVFADDWISPNCLEEMVSLAERNPSVGIISAYTTDGKAVRWQGPSDPGECLSGLEVCRNYLRGGPYVFGTMTSLMIRSDLIRKRANLFAERNLQADLETCFDLLQESDFGFIHQVLSFGRERENSTDSIAANLNSHGLGEFLIFLKYGRLLLAENEHKQHWDRVSRRYHRLLAHNVLRLRSGDFWKYHNHLLAAYGGRIDRWLLTKSVAADLASQLTHPINAFRQGVRWWFPSAKRGASKKETPQQPLNCPKALNDTDPLKPA